jgi:hypothetical protein
MAIAFIQSAANGANALTTTITATLANTTTGNLLVAAVSWDPNARTCTVSDGTNSFTSVEVQFNDSNNQVYQLFYAKNITGLTTPTVTASFSGNTDFRRIVVMEFSGADTSSPLDKFTHGEDATRAPTSASMTTTTDGQLIFGAIMNDGGDATEVFSAGAGYNEPASGSTGSAANNEIMGEYQIQSSAGAITVVWSRSNVSGTPHNGWVCGTFKAAASVSKTYFQSQGQTSISSRTIMVGT